MPNLTRTPKGKRSRSSSTPNISPLTDESEFESKEEKRESVRETLSEMMSYIKETNTKVTHMSTQMAGVKLELEELRGQITCFKSEMNGLKLDLEHFRGRATKQEESILELREQVKRLEGKHAPSEDKVRQLASLIQKEDFLRRTNNLVVTGLEPVLHEGKTREKCLVTANWLINSKLEMNVEVKEARRLGKMREDGSAAPLLIIMGTSREKWAVFKN